MPGSTTTAALERAVHRYRSASIATRTLVHGRAFLTDLAVVDQYVPKHGFIVDLGCGHGHISLTTPPSFLCQANMKTSSTNARTLPRSCALNLTSMM